MNYIDLFSGAGGMTLGFESEEFNNLFSIELDENSTRTYKTNFKNHNIINKDITKISEEEILNITDGEHVDVVIGGPPCQGFSIAGNIGRKFIDDDRNHLFKEFVRFVSILKPKIFVMENVARLATHNKGTTIREIHKAFEYLGYNVKSQILKAEYYNVPQKRHRVFIIGTLNLSFQFPVPYENDFLTVKDAIHDLPSLKSGETSVIPNHFAMKHSPQMLNKMSYIKDGGGREQIPIEYRPTSGDVRKYIRYDSKKPSITITGDMRKVFHYDQNRALSPRELARIQTFPDDFVFEGNSISIQQQIGNAVPPNLSRAIAREVKRSLRNNDN